jgi:hypothetical protein
MRIRFLVFLVSALALFVAPSWAATCGPTDSTVCTVTVSPADTTAVFDFSQGGNGRLVVQFDTVLTTFMLTVTVRHTLNPIDPDDFPSGTVCIQYTNGMCAQYEFSATGTTGNGPDGDPVKGIDFKGLITLTLNYDSFQTVHIPAFGHAPGLNASAEYTDDILTSYVDNDAPSCTNCDPAMGGKTPGISPFAALDVPFDPSIPDGNIVCSPGVTAVPQTSTSGQNPIFEVSFKLVASGGNCSTGPFLRDKTATLTVASLGTDGNLNFTNLINNGDANKFHFDNKNGTNVQDINTKGLSSGTYYVTVISTQFSPVTTTFNIP